MKVTIYFLKRLPLLASSNIAKKHASPTLLLRGEKKEKNLSSTPFFLSHSFLLLLFLFFSAPEYSRMAMEYMPTSFSLSLSFFLFCFHLNLTLLYVRPSIREYVRIPFSSLEAAWFTPSIARW